jgi:hypothetical protein
MLRFLKYVIWISIVLIFLFLFSGIISVLFPYMSKIILTAVVIIVAFILFRALYFWLLRVGSNK